MTELPNNTSFEVLWTAIVGVFLLLWLIGSVFHQFRLQWWNRIARFDQLNLLPRWTFFAPNPGRNDYHIVYRNWVDENPGEWQEICTFTTGSLWRWIWNPSRYPSKAVSDLANALSRSIYFHRDEPRAVLLSDAYISILSWVMSQQPTLPETSHRQFALIVTQGFGDNRQLELKYLSKVHRVDH